jgi:two-component system chemotaxis sensor kinase CheA
VAYGFGEVVDLVTLQNVVKPAAIPGEIAGVTLIDGEQVEVIDPYWLFAACAADASSAPSAPLCAIPADDPWMQNILRPILVSAGYRVAASGEVAAPDIVIASAEAPVDAGGGDAGIIRIRALPGSGSSEDGSIYRYDRAGLFAALGRAGRKG